MEADLHERYGIDVDDTDLMTARSWRWLRTRVVQLLKVPPTVVYAPGGTVHEIPATRVGLALVTPE